jgi:sterol desaturase/sphingolipid hydroxylase (fatty acid hydroxylase superfamily)
VSRRYQLDKMTLAELVVAYFTHYSILVYLVLALAAIGLAVHLAPGWGGPLAAVAVTLLVYPLAEYLLHRFVLHGRFLYKSPLTAKVWKRIHYDHHADPHDLAVLFGALYTTLPTIASIALPLGWAIAGPAGALVAFATALLLFAGYEFCHCVQHLPFTPASRWLREIKRRHLAHHFHNEHGNFGITSGLWDRLLGTLYQHPREVPRSPTTFNLGYTTEERQRYPWVADLSPSEDELATRRMRRAA